MDIAASMIQKNWKKFQNGQQFIAERMKMYQATTDVQLVHLANQVYGNNLKSQQIWLNNKYAVKQNEVNEVGRQFRMPAKIEHPARNPIQNRKRSEAPKNQKKSPSKIPISKGSPLHLNHFDLPLSIE